MMNPILSSSVRRRMRGVRTPILIGASDDPPPTVAYFPVTLSPVPEVFFSLSSA